MLEKEGEDKISRPNKKENKMSEDIKKQEKPTISAFNLTINQNIADVLGKVCDAALKSGGLTIINEVNLILNWARSAVKTELKK